ncbi:MAG: biotin/lipoate A/B protein ligase family protein, partial [Promethearchaeota archaeon]
MQGHWRLIRTEPHTAFDNMAIDHVLLNRCQRGEAPNTLRFYRWSPSAVSIGRFQRILDEVDVEACKEKGVDIIRRRSSGGAVYHDFEGELTVMVEGTNSEGKKVSTGQSIDVRGTGILVNPNTN